MTAEQFWKDDPQLFVSFRTFYINKKEREANEIDYKCWLQGLYIHDGNTKISATLKQFLGNLIAAIFKKTKDNREIEKYPSKPYTIQEKEKREKAQSESKKSKYEKYESDLYYFSTLKKRYLETLKNK